MMIKNPAFNDQKSSKAEAAISQRMIPVRCGKCEGCLKSNISNWSFRLQQESKRSTSVAFVTLTYTPEFVPLTENQLPTLSKRDVQLYIKRLRKATANRLKYFAVGEYGSRTYRPHYHLILFNAESRQSIIDAWTRNGDIIGNVHIGDTITDGAIPYTLKYMYKKGLVPAFNDDDRLPEFRIMSQKLGSNYLTPAMIKWHLTDLENRQYCVIENGIKVSLPRYYREKLIQLSGQPRELFRKEESVFMTEEDNDYRTLESRIAVQKFRQEKFEKTRNQDNRKTI